MPVAVSLSKLLTFALASMAPTPPEAASAPPEDTAHAPESPAAKRRNTVEAAGASRSEWIDPAGAASETSEAGASAAEGRGTDSSAPAYGATEARADVQTVLTDTSMPYIRARGRLQAHPDVAAPELVARLEAMPPLGPGERKRLLDILAALGRPEDMPRLQQAFIRALRNAGDERAQRDVLELWRPLLLARGSAASSALQELVGEHSLPVAIRQVLLRDWIASAAAPQVPQFIALVGRGQAQLQEELRDGLRERTANSPALAEQLRTAVASELAAESDARRRTALLALSIELSAPDDEERVSTLQSLALAGNERFPMRVVAVRGLARLKAFEALAEVARRLLPQRDTQAGEVLTALAVGNLPRDKAQQVVAEVGLADSPAPRLATLGYRFGAVPSAPDWLAHALSHPWPQVRHAALERVQSPCSETTIRRLRKAADASEKKGESDPTAARAVVMALGRCGSFDLLQRILEDANYGMEQRAEAARQLVKRGGPDGADQVAKILERDLQRPLARRLARALGYSEAPTPRVLRALCERVDDRNEVGRAALEALRLIAPAEHTCELDG